MAVAHVTVTTDFSGLPKFTEALGRLMDSAAQETAETILEAARRNAPVETGELRDSGRITQGDVTLDTGAGRFRDAGTGRFVAAAEAVERAVVFDAPHAAAQEYGGTWDVPVTKKSRRFFWAKFRETGDEKWKAMALTQKTSFSITLQAQPYLTPAYHAHRDLLRRLVDQGLSRL